MIHLIIDGTPKFGTSIVNSDSNPMPKIKAKIATLYRIGSNKTVEKYTVMLEISPLYTHQQIRIYSAGCNGYEPFISKWTDRLNKANVNWAHCFQKNILEPKNSTVAYFSKWASVQIVNEYDGGGQFPDYNFIPMQQRALRCLWNKGLIPYPSCNGDTRCSLKRFIL